MIELSGDAYLWIKAFHLISVISWMAGLLYLPRLYVYHTQCDVGSQQSETFKVMERRLLRAIMTPAMIASLLFGGLLLMNMGDDVWTEVWIYIKLGSVIALMASHMSMSAMRKAFEEDRNTRSKSFFRTINEVPTVLMIVIVIFVIVKPF